MEGERLSCLHTECDLHRARRWVLRTVVNRAYQGQVSKLHVIISGWEASGLYAALTVTKMCLS